MGELTDIREYVRFVADVAANNMRTADSPTAGWAYTSTHELLLVEGRQFGPLLDPDPYDLAGTGQNRECFRNAYMAASEHPDLTYVEGYALSLIPTLHAWCVTKDGEVLDPTWDEGGSDYFGIAFDIAWLARWMERTGRWGVFGGEHSELLQLVQHGLPDDATVNVGGQ